MFNVTVIKLKDIVKFVILILAILICIIFTPKIMKNFKIKNTLLSEKINKKIATKCLKVNLPEIIDINDKNSVNKPKEKYYKKIIESEISVAKIIENSNKNETVQVATNVDNTEKTASSNSENQNMNVENTSIEKTNEENNSASVKTQIVDSEKNVKTEVITKNPIPENANAQYQNVKIKNQTSYNLTEDVLNPNIKIENKNIVIFHTHSCESYTPSDKYQYTQTGNYRTTDKNFSVIRVGEELTNYLKQYDINVIHNTDYHDYPSYTGSYGRSLKTVENIIKTTPSDIIIDLHRDAVGSRPDYSPTVKIGDEECAQIMFVIGTNDGGMWHPNWQENLKFAVAVQKKGEEMYPGLFKPIMLTKSRYNQHSGKYANIIEVGATGNTLDQCLSSMKYLSIVLNEILK